MKLRLFRFSELPISRTCYCWLCVSQTKPVEKRITKKSWISFQISGQRCSDNTLGAPRLWLETKGSAKKQLPRILRKPPSASAGCLCNMSEAAETLSAGRAGACGRGQDGGTRCYRHPKPPLPAWCSRQKLVASLLGVHHA